MKWIAQSSVHTLHSFGQSIIKPEITSTQQGLSRGNILLAACKRSSYHWQPIPNPLPNVAGMMAIPLLDSELLLLLLRRQTV